MDYGIAQGSLPLRPMTVGELLDAALVLLRTRARLLLGAGLALAATEQAVLYVLRQAARLDSSYIPREGYVPQWLLVVVTGFAAEAMILAVLGGLAATAALPALLGRPVPRPRRPGMPVAAAVATVAVVSGLVCGLGSLTVLPWLLCYPLVGLAAPVVAVDRAGPGRALLRSARLVLRSGFRPGAIRLLGYVGWLFFRLALGLGVQATLDLVPLDVAAWRELAPVFTWLVVNALAYPILGCLDAVLHLEARMRTEGLDIALSRALRRGESVEPALAVP